MRVSKTDMYWKILDNESPINPPNTLLNKK